MTRLAIVLAMAGVAAGCTGSIEGSSRGKDRGANPTEPTGPDDTTDPNTTTPTPPGTGGKPGGMGMMNPPTPPAPPSAQILCDEASRNTVGRRALRRLTNAELETTIRTVFGLDTKQWAGMNVPPDSGSLDGFTNNVDSLTVSADYAQGALESSRKVASLVSAAPMLASLVPCAATGGATCAETFVTGFGAKLYRRPLTAVEKQRYLSLFDKVGKTDFGAFVYWATSTMLQSPNVIYRSELGESDGAGRWKLTSYEVASELSYTFTGGPPTAALMQLAANNQLGTADQIEAAARTLVFDGQSVRPAFRDVLLHFADEWLGLPSLSNLKKDAMKFPDFNEQIQDSMAEETRRFIAGVVLEDKGNVAALLTAPFTYVDAALTKYYGFGAGAGTDFARTNRPMGWGLGLLGQGSVMAVAANGLASSPTKRGHMVRTRLLCGTVPPPPPVVAPISEPSEGATTRQRYEKHSTDNACRSCHALMDPIGFAFEHLDSAGKFRALEGKFNIDDSAIVADTSAGDLNVTGAAALSTALSKLPEVSDCMASYVAGYAIGVGHESASCVASNAIGELRTGGSLVDFYIRLARADHFRMRQ
jgi:hypothetical protein